MKIIQNTALPLAIEKEATNDVYSPSNSNTEIPCTCTLISLLFIAIFSQQFFRFVTWKFCCEKYPIHIQVLILNQIFQNGWQMGNCDSVLDTMKPLQSQHSNSNNYTATVIYSTGCSISFIIHPFDSDRVHDWPTEFKSNSKWKIFRNAVCSNEKRIFNQICMCYSFSEIVSGSYSL